MSVREDIRAISADLDTAGLLRYLITEKFPGETVVTASLRGSSIAVLKMVADVDPATPVIFCQRPPIFEESSEYRQKIVDLLGLTNTSMSDGRETEVKSGDQDHVEDMWLSYKNMPGTTYQILHLNNCLSPYKCWISAVYHVPPARTLTERVSVDGCIIKVDPLVRWSKADVHKFMTANKLPYHKMATRTFEYDNSEAVDIPPTYPF